MCWVNYDFQRDRVSGTLRCSFKLVSTETLCAYRDTSQTGIIFSSVSVSVSFCRVHEKLKSCAAAGRHDAPAEEGKQKHREIREKLACSPGSDFYINSINIFPSESLKSQTTLKTIWTDAKNTENQTCSEKIMTNKSFRVSV